jgi:hypothetical protein
MAADLGRHPCLSIPVSPPVKGEPPPLALALRGGDVALAVFDRPSVRVVGPQAKEVFTREVGASCGPRGGSVVISRGIGVVVGCWGI